MRLIFISFFLFWSSLLLAFPNAEKANLDLDINQASTDIQVSPDDRYVVLENGPRLVILDTADWELRSSQIDIFEDTITSFAFRSNSSLFVALEDGQLFNFDPSNTDHEDDLLEEDTISRQFDQMALQKTGDTNYLYLLNKSADVIYKYQITTASIVGTFTLPTIAEFGELAEEYELLDMALIELPNADNEGSDDKLIIGTDKSRVLIVNAENMTLSSTLILSGEFEDAEDGGADGCTFTNEDNENNHEIALVAVDPDRRTVYAIDTDDNLVYAIDPIDEVQVDADLSKAGNNPFCINSTHNDELTDLMIINVSEPTSEIYAYVAGANGISLFNADLDEVEYIDSEDLNPIQLNSSIPIRLAASSLEDAYVYSVNADGSLSIISDNPFIEISGITTDDVDNKITEDHTSFSLTFQVDEVCETCAYRIIANSTIKEVGGEVLASGTLSGQLANADITIADIETDGYDLEEGENEIFLFIDDAEGNTGRDMYPLIVDLPPPDVSILSSSFGVNKGLVTIQRLTESDIAQYNIFVLEAENQANPECPGTLDFSAIAINNSVIQADSGAQQTLSVTGLENEVYYCIAIQAEDESGQLSPNRVEWTSAILPQTVIGIIGRSGENPNCELVLDANPLSYKIWFLLLGQLIFFLFLRQRILR